ncbi:unnamed protein product [Adineta steineri]|uniref:Peptide hydrolase n=1 Tax=Adineta steineri TaxID=433720 RepID=A0A815Q2R9_9BILA|nr:unnamed protein product [Adineta steineri]
MKKTKIYIVLGIILFLIIITIALVASTLGIVVRQSKTETKNVECNEGALVCSISSNDLMKHLQQLQNIADESNSTRAIHTKGFNQTFDYIYNYLKTNTNLKVQTEYFSYMKFILNNTPMLSTNINGLEMNYTYGLKHDFTYLRNSESSDFNTPFQVTSIPNFGCDESDWLNATSSSSSLRDKIALIKRGNCTFTEKSLLAVKYGVVGLLIYNDGTTPNRYSPVSGRVDQNITFPALSISYQIASSLVNAIQNVATNVVVRIHISTTKYPEPVGNICAHTITGDATQTIVIGSHTDSVPEGPGINDDGSGTATNLVLATNLDRLFQTSSYPPYKYRVKFCWWGAEEVGIVGSRYHVSQANYSTIPGERISDYLVNLNYDMLGSPNFQMGIYDGHTANFSTTPPKAIPGSIRLTELFRNWFIDQNLPYTISELGGGSDYASFLAAGIVISGLNSGISDIKTKEERDYYNRLLGQGNGGVANAEYDPCYHQSCDSLANINPLGHEKLSKAAAYILEYLGRHSDLRSYLYPSDEIRQLEKISTYRSTEKDNVQYEFYRINDL